MHLGQPPGQPAGLLAVEAARRAPGQAGGVQRDQPGGLGVVDVVGGAVQPVLRGEPVPGRARAGQEMGLDEVPPGDRPPRGVGGDGAGRARQEGLRAVGEQLQRPVVVEGFRQRQRLPGCR
jgi:hypothetical protein